MAELTVHGLPIERAKEVVRSRMEQINGILIGDDGILLCIDGAAVATLQWGDLEADLVKAARPNLGHSIGTNPPA